MNIDINKLPNGTESVLKGKFHETIKLLEGACTESSNDKSYGTTWSMGKIKETLRDIKINFYNDLKILSKEIEDCSKVESISTPGRQIF